MENSDPKFKENTQGGQSKPVEHDYSNNDQDPGPSPQAVHEKNNKGAGPILKWIIPALLVIMAVLYYLFFNDRPQRM